MRITGGESADADRTDPGTPVATPPARTDAARRMFGRDGLYFAAYSMQFVSSAVVAPVLARELGGTGFGVVATDLAVMQLCVIIINLGINSGVQRTFARNGLAAARAAAGLGMVAAIGLGALLWVTTSMWASGVGLQGQETSLRMAVAWSGLAAATNAVAAMARSLDRLRAYAIITVTQSVAAQAAGLVLAAVQHRQPYGYFEGALACQAVALAMACVVARPTVRIVKQRSAMGPMMIFSLGMLPQGVASFVLSSADRIIVQRDLGPWAVGRYQLAYNLGAVGILLAASLNGAWIPTLLAITSRDHLAQVLEETRDRLGWLVVTSVVGMAVGFPAILILWVPRQDLPSHLVGVLMCVVASTIFYVFFTLSARAYIVDGRSWWVASATLAGAVANVPLNLVLVPRLGILGSAVATTASYAVSWVAVLCGMRGSDLAPGPNWRLVAGLAAASGLCTLSVFVPVDGAWLVSRWVLAAWALAVMTWQTGVLRWIGQRSGVTAKEPFAGR